VANPADERTPAARLDGATLEQVADFYSRVWSVEAEGALFESTFRDLSEAFRVILGPCEITWWIPDPVGGANGSGTAGGVLNPASTTLAPPLLERLSDRIGMQDSCAGKAFESGRPVYSESGSPGAESDWMAASGAEGIWAIPLPAPALLAGDDARNPHNIIAVGVAALPAGSAAGALAPETPAFFARVAGKQIERAFWGEQDLVVHEAFAALDTLQADRYRALDAVADAIRRSLQFEACTILQSDEARRVLTVLGTTGIDSRVSRRKMEHPYGFSLSGTVAVEKRVLAIEDARTSGRWGSTRLFPDTVEHPDRFQYLGAPLLSDAGELLGVIRLRNKRPPAGRGGPLCLNRLDTLRIERVSKVIAPLMALMIRETEMSAALKRIQHDIDMPATAIRDGAGVLKRRVEHRLSPDLAVVRQRYDNAEPLGRMGADIELLLQKLEDIESFGEILLVNSVLMGIFDAEDLPISPQPVLLVRDVVAKLSKMLTPLAREKQLSGILYSQHTLFAIPALWLDVRLIEIALYNLLQNALKYSNPDTMVVIEGEATKIDGKPWFAVHVKNQGIGVAEEDSSKIFQRYYRAAKARRRAVTGLGIGLSTAKSIVERHGGRLILTQKDNPTIFSILFPESLASRKPE
jgi:signal transduction histidine kinase